jgi:NodT family efflux transporter outer membrane factor (OMF) lipoprotein
MKRRTLRATAAVATLALATACTVGPDFHRPAKPKIEGYSPESLAPQTASAEIADGGATQTFQPGADIPAQWWELYRSPELNGLIEAALTANPDLDAAQASLRQANELLYAQQGTLFPSITGNAAASQQKSTGAAFGTPGPAVVFGVTTASLNISYNADLWGGGRRSVEAQAAQAEFQRYQLEATYLTLTSNVVVTAVNLASLRAQIAATQEIIRILQDSLRVVETQFNLGGASRADVLVQQTALTSEQALLPPLQKQLAQQRNALMTLLGRPPTADGGQGIELSTLHLPEDLPLSLPSQLVDQRPDVRSSEANLHTASANIGVATAAQLPQFSITALFGAASGGFATLFLPGSGVWSMGASLAQTIFDAGQLEHKKLAAVAAYDKAAAQYRSTALTAFQDVANALRALQADADALKAAVAAEQTAQQTLSLAQQQYQLGAINYLTLLVAQTAYENTLLNRVRAQATRYSDTAALFQALGGGWWNRTDVDPKSKGEPGVLWLPPVQDVKLPRAGR